MILQAQLLLIDQYLLMIYKKTTASTDSNLGKPTLDDFRNRRDLWCKELFLRTAELINAGVTAGERNRYDRKEYKYIM